MPTKKKCTATKEDRAGLKFTCELEAHAGARHRDPERGQWFEKNRSAKGEGSIFQRDADGMFVGQISIGSGKQRTRPTVVASTEAEVRRKLADLKVKAANNQLPKGQITLARWLDYYVPNIAVKKRWRPGTAASNRSKVGYIVDAIGTVRLDKLTPLHVRRLEDHILAKGLSTSTAKTAHAILSQALRYAEQDGRVFRNVAQISDKPKVRKTELDTLTGEDGIRVLGAAAGHWEGDRWQQHRLGSRWAAALLTGARQGELLGLEIDRVSDVLDLSWQLQQISWQHGCGEPIGEETLVRKDGKKVKRTVYPCGMIRGTDCPTRKLDSPADWEHRHLTGGLYLSRPKSNAGWRIIPLVEPLKGAIEARIEASMTEPNPYNLLWTADPKKTRQGKYLPLDGSPIYPGDDSRAWHALLKDAKVPDVRLHDARHTTVTLLYDAGVSEADIQDIIGHSTVSMSRSYRNKGNTAQLRDAMLKLSGQLELPVVPHSAPNTGDN